MSDTDHEIELIRCGGCERHSLLADAKAAAEWENREIGKPHCPRCGTRVEYEDTTVETWERSSVDTGAKDLEGFEEKKDELWDGLLTAYAAGFSKAADTFDADPDFDTDVQSLKQNEALTENHYYFWDGRTFPLEFWLREQYGLDQEVSADAE